MPVVVLLMLAGCTGQAWCDRFNLDCEPPDDTVHDAPPDSDGDVWPDDEDCAPDDPAISPSVEEVCDGIDNDCDGLVDEGTPGMQTWYRDRDGDGYGDDGWSTESCEPVDGHVRTGGDCDDTRPGIHPGVAEICGNGLDDDCSGDAPECPFADLSTSEDALSSFVPDDGDGVIGHTISVSPGTLGDPDLHVLLGSPQDRYRGVRGGGVYLVPGGDAALEYARDAVGSLRILTSLEEGNAVGAAIVADLDVNGDGAHDLVVGAPGAESAETDEGVACVLVSPVGSLLRRLEADCDLRLTGGREGAAFGSSLATVADETRWASAALAVGAPGDDAGAGSVALFAPPVSSGEQAADAWLRVEGSAQGGALGSAMTRADLNGDGIDDLVLAAPAAGSGRVVVGFGPLDDGIVDADDLGATLEGITDGDEAGVALAARGDLDGDGRADLLVGAPGAHAGQGAVYLLRGGDTLHRHTGRISLEVADGRFDGSQPGAAAGQGLASGGDFDDDGHPDILIGAPGDTAPPSDGDASGSVYIVYGDGDAGGGVGTVDLAPGAIRILAAPGVQEFGTSLGVAHGDGATRLDSFFVGAPGGLAPAVYFFRSLSY